MQGRHTDIPTLVSCLRLAATERPMSDPRFARLKSDPRFRRPRKLQSRLVVDNRFKRIFEHSKDPGGKPTSTPNVDKYGRPLSDTHEQDNLRRFYRLDNEHDGVSKDTPKSAPDYARGEILMESEDEGEDQSDDDDDDGDTDALIGHAHSTPIAVLEEEAEVDLDETHFEDLDAQAAEYCKNMPEQLVEHPECTQTRRLAVVNLDWDHVKAIHLYRIFSSLVSPTAPAVTKPVDSEHQPSVKGGPNHLVRGHVLSVRIYPSEFGKERLAREEKEGPPPEIFKRGNQGDDNEVNEQNIYEVGGEEEYDDVALRNYQLERLRYYYAIVSCDTVDAASHIYSELDGTELERSANVLDLSFVPDDMTFGKEFRDEATHDYGTVHKGIDFVTAALRHSKVALSWDEDDPERTQITRRALTRQEIDEADFKAYLASSTSGSESETDNLKGKSEKTATSRNKLRALLLEGGDDELPEGWGRENDDNSDNKGAVDMEITFTHGLSESKGEQDETTLEKYQRKMKERRKKRKEVKDGGSERQRQNAETEEDDFFNLESGDDGETEPEGRLEDKTKKKKNPNDLDSSRNATSRPLATPTELELLLAADNPNTEPKHFNLKSILKAEKKLKQKRKKEKKAIDVDDEVQEDFAIDVKDDRFKALHEDHTFAIDPSNPHFKKTKSMVALMQARSKMRRHDREHSGAIISKKPGGDSERSLQSLVDSVKRKSAAVQLPAIGKRRKL